MSHIDTGDGTLVHHFEHESKWQWMEYRNGLSSGNKKSNSALSAEENMVRVFWNKKGVILVIFLPGVTKVKPDHHIETLRILNTRLYRFPSTTQSLMYCPSTTKLSRMQG